MFVDHPLLPGTHWDVSAFRGSRRILIFQPVQEIIPKNFKLQIRSKVGLILFSSSESVCEVRFSRNQFYPGEMVDIWLDTDNSKCS